MLVDRSALARHLQGSATTPHVNERQAGIEATVQIGAVIREPDGRQRPLWIAALEDKIVP
jgi:hypothetical protein